jgi:hypothetical protein
MRDRPGVIGVESVQEHEDGSATYQLHMDGYAQAMLIEEGIKFILHCAAAKVDIADVYDWILSQMPEEEEPEAKLPEGRTPLDDDWFREKAAAFNFDEYGYYGENNGPLPPTEKIREMNEQERQRSKEREQANKKKDE